MKARRATFNTMLGATVVASAAIVFDDWRRSHDDEPFGIVGMYMVVTYEILKGILSKDGEW